MTIFRVLALALQTGLIRAGDIARTGGYTGMEAVCWKDVTIALEMGPAPITLFHVASVT